jgi:hypothetical protein
LIDGYIKYVREGGRSLNVIRNKLVITIIMIAKDSRRNLNEDLFNGRGACTQ